MILWNFSMHNTARNAKLFLNLYKRIAFSIQDTEREISWNIPYGLTAEVFRNGRVFSLDFMLWFY